MNSYMQVLGSSAETSNTTGASNLLVAGRGAAPHVQEALLHGGGIGTTGEPCLPYATVAFVREDCEPSDPRHHVALMRVPLPSADATVRQVAKAAMSRLAYKWRSQQQQQQQQHLTGASAATDMAAAAGVGGEGSTEKKGQFPFSGVSQVLAQLPQRALAEGPAAPLTAPLPAGLTPTASSETSRIASPLPPAELLSTDMVRQVVALADEVLVMRLRPRDGARLTTPPPPPPPPPAHCTEEKTVAAVESVATPALTQAVAATMGTADAPPTHRKYERGSSASTLHKRKREDVPPPAASSATPSTRVKADRAESSSSDDEDTDDDDDGEAAGKRRRTQRTVLDSPDVEMVARELRAREPHRLGWGPEAHRNFSANYVQSPQKLMARPRQSGRRRGAAAATTDAASAKVKDIRHAGEEEVVDHAASVVPLVTTGKPDDLAAELKASAVEPSAAAARPVPASFVTPPAPAEGPASASSTSTNPPPATEAKRLVLRLDISGRRSAPESAGVSLTGKGFCPTLAEVRQKTPSPPPMATVAAKTCTPPEQTTARRLLWDDMDTSSEKNSTSTPSRDFRSSQNPSQARVAAYCGNSLSLNAFKPSPVKPTN